MSREDLGRVCIYSVNHGSVYKKKIMDLQEHVKIVEDPKSADLILCIGYATIISSKEILDIRKRNIPTVYLTSGEVKNKGKQALLQQILKERDRSGRTLDRNRGMER